jgi:2'-5' RNA ligase
VAQQLTDRERYLRRVEALALSALPITTLPVTAAAPTHHDGVMVALVPDEPEALALDHSEALPAEDLHITLCYLGKAQDLSSFDKTSILAKTRKVCAEVGHSFSTTSDGVVVMGQNDDGVPATALLVQSDDIVKLYDALSETLNYQSKFPSFIPHMTTGYGVPVEAAQEKVGQPINFNNVLVKFGDTRHLIPLASSIVAAPGGPNVIDRVIDSLGRLWDEALHPRDAEGKFIKKNGAVSGKLAIPSADRKSVNTVDANRASVIGFHTFDNDVWVLTEVTNPDGTKSQGFARASEVRAVAPVKARLDALYPVTEGEAFVDSSLERSRQLDLILAKITSDFGLENDEDGAMAFLETLGLSDKDLDYVFSGDIDYLGGMKKVDQQLDDEELAEQADIIEDAKLVKSLRDRVHGLEEEHVVPSQKILSGDAPDAESVESLQNGADPLTVQSKNLIGAMEESGRFQIQEPTSETGISQIFWYIDPTDETDREVWLAGTGTTTRNRAYFVKESIIGAEDGNSDIAKEVIVSLIHEQIADDRALIVPRSVFGDNPEWDGKRPEERIGDRAHQAGHVLSEHAGYLVPADSKITDMFAEEVSFRNDTKDLDGATQADQRAAFEEDMGELYGNSLAKMVLLDFALMNQDRNPSNALLISPPNGTEGSVVLIDHGFSFSPEAEELGIEEMAKKFDWFMDDYLTKSWLAYIRGGLALNENVTETSIRQMVADFADAYGRIDADAVLTQFRSMPGISEDQIGNAEAWLTDLLDRITWIGQNQEAVLSRIINGSTP